MMIPKVMPTAVCLLLTFIALSLSARNLSAATLAAAAVESLARSNSFDIPAQALQSSIIEFALQANVTVIADHQLLKHHRSPALSGPLRTDTALLSLLAGSGLEYSYLASANSFVIQPKSPAVLQQALTESEEAYAVEEVVVTGVRYPFRFNTITNTQTQGGMSYFDSSRFLNVIPRALIDDQRPVALGDVLKFASGITPGDGATDTNDDIYIRGFQRHAIYLDGFRLSDSSGVKLSPANTERIEILKGPATLFYGQAEPGGIVNVIRKKPQDTRFVNLESGVGTRGRQFINLDANGQLFANSGINMRLVAADDKQAEAGEIRDIHTQFVAPSLEWQIAETTSINASYNYQNETRTWNRDFAVFLPYGSFPGASLSQIAPQYQADFNTEASLFSAEINHYFTAEWRLRASYFWQEEIRHGIRTSADSLLKSDLLLDREALGPDFASLVFSGQLVLPLIMDTSGPVARFSAANVRSIYDAADTEYGQNTAVNLEGSFALGGITHHLTTGFDWTRQDIYQQLLVESRNLFPGQTWTDLTSLDTILTLASGLLYPRPVSDTFEQQDLQLIYNDYGAYIQDNIELNEQWILSLGTRYTLTEGKYANISDSIFNALPDYNNVSSQLGVTFKPSDKQSVFFNYSEAMRASYHNEDISLQSPEPVLSEQFEVGLKSLFDDGKLLTSIALFNIEKRNIVAVNIIEGFRTSLEAYQQNVKGVDMDLTWQISQQLELMAALSLIDAKIVSGKDVGSRPPLVARQTASLFGRYTINDVTHLSLGVNHVGARSGRSEGANLLVDEASMPELNLKPYTTVDLAVNYKFSMASYSPELTISAKNLFDKKYYTAVLGGFRQNESEARTLVAALKVSF